MKKISIILALITAVSGAAFAQSRCLTPEFEEARKQLYKKYGQPQPRLRAETTDHSVGDTMTFWRWDLSVMPPVWILEPATCRAVTQNSYVFVTLNFGPPPDMLDNDDHIYIFYSELGSFNGVVFDGYFSVFNEYTEEEAQNMGGHSNEVSSI
jgi:hypothetical protein